MNRNDLKDLLDREKVDPAAYHLDGQAWGDSYTIRLMPNGIWRVFFFECGREIDPVSCESEHRACVELLYRLLRDHVSCPAAKL